MTRKKETHLVISPAEEAQVQDLLAQFHQIAQQLRASTNREQAEAALTVIASVSEPIQLELLKALSKERDVEAADVLLALNELSTNKNVRKEARRSLIRLEETRVHPQWHPPALQNPLNQLSPAPPRFWKGTVSQDREKGEVRMVL